MDISFEDKDKELYYDEHIEILIKNPNLPLFLLNEISHNPDLVQGIRETLRYDQLRERHLPGNMQRSCRDYGIKKDDTATAHDHHRFNAQSFPFAARDVIKMMMPAGRRQ
ncbi:MAG: hypothetical protein MZV63_25125 [Marinilabiliales bacterium]|nr:hypothetical protein [Marinilabiliales bacterium]